MLTCRALSHTGFSTAALQAMREKSVSPTRPRLTSKEKQSAPSRIGSGGAAALQPDSHTLWSESLNNDGVAAIAADPVPRARVQSRSIASHRTSKFTSLLSSTNLDLDALRTASWSGIPPDARATTWQLLSGYLPANMSRRQATLVRKREEYQGFLDQYLVTRAYFLPFICFG